MTSPPTVLVFTFPEYGQANVNLATSYELALAGVNVCIASFASLEPRVSRLQELVVRHRDAACSDDRPTGSISFRECKGFPSYMEVVVKHGRVSRPSGTSPHGVSGALASYSRFGIALFPWSPEEHLAGIESIKEVIATVKPSAVIIDAYFYIAIDACELVSQKFSIMFPNAIKDAAEHLQPCLAAFWKYPVLSSGFPFPLKWWQIPINVYLCMRLRIQMKSKRIKQFQALRRSLGNKAITTYQLYPGVPHICPALPETDFPFAFVPEEMILCGPIILPFDSLEERDPTLMTWLDKGLTVMINLGSHFVCNEQLAKEMASAFRILFDYHDRKSSDKIQVLWKVKPDGDIQNAIDVVIGKEIKEGRVKVVSWLEADPVSILQHPNVVCTVHHGGANSYYEGVWSGLPHIILPTWMDTYAYAARVEFLNIGIFGSKTSAPSFRAEELGDALVRVTGNTEEARMFRSAAQRLKAICREKGEGRKLASAVILKEIGIKT